MRILAVVAHPDDEVLGCGGSIARYVRCGNDVSVYVLSSRGLPWEIMARDAARTLGHTVEFSTLGLVDQKFDANAQLEITQDIERVIRETMPNHVWTHYPNDVNRDHRIVAESVLIATRPNGSLPYPVTSVCSFEVPSSTEWGSPPYFSPHRFVALSSEDLVQKLAAMRLCYAREQPKWPHPRSERALCALAQWRGASCGHEYAEAFRVEREVV